MQIIIYDDQLLFSEALSTLLAKRGHKVLACATTIEQLLQQLETSTPDACLIDVHHKRDDVSNIVLKVRQQMPDIALLVLAEELNFAGLSLAVDAGADGVCLKQDGIDEIDRILERVVISRRLARPDGSTPNWSRRALALTRPNTISRDSESVTPREQAVLKLLVRGASTATIAKELSVGQATIRTHLQHLFNKFGVHSRLALVACAVRAGVVHIDENHSYVAQSS